jgi:hypothetical protein
MIFRHSLSFSAQHFICWVHSLSDSFKHVPQPYWETFSVSTRLHADMGVYIGPNGSHHKVSCLCILEGTLPNLLRTVLRVQC